MSDIYVDLETRQREWVLVNTGLFGTKETFIPLIDTSEQGDTIVVPYSKDIVKDAPRIDSDGEISQEEAELYPRYGLCYSDNRSGSGLPDQRRSTAGDATLRQTATMDTSRASTGHDTSGPTTDDAMTRSEEELRVSTARRPSELVRPKKYIVTEQQQVTVPVQHEEVRLEREPITDANRGAAMSGPDLSSEEHDLTLNEEEIVIDKRVVPTERVRRKKRHHRGTNRHRRSPQRADRRARRKSHEQGPLRGAADKASARRRASAAVGGCRAGSTAPSVPCWGADTEMRDS